MKNVYIETSIVSYLTARAGRDQRANTWRELTVQWWEHEKIHYTLFTSELVLAEAEAGDPDASKRRLAILDDIPLLDILDEAIYLANCIIAKDGLPKSAHADALHIALATVHHMDYLLTWNCRHIDNATTKPLVRAICANEGYPCPEICTPFELTMED